MRLFGSSEFRTRNSRLSSTGRLELRNFPNHLSDAFAGEEPSPGWECTKLEQPCFIHRKSEPSGYRVGAAWRLETKQEEHVAGRSRFRRAKTSNAVSVAFRCPLQAEGLSVSRDCCEIRAGSNKNIAGAVSPSGAVVSASTSAASSFAAAVASENVAG